MHWHILNPIQSKYFDTEHILPLPGYSKLYIFTRTAVFSLDFLTRFENGGDLSRNAGPPLKYKDDYTNFDTQPRVFADKIWTKDLIS